MSSTDQADVNPANSQRSYVLEIIGVLSGIAFFVGVFFAFRTQTSGLVTQSEFDQLQNGQTLFEVNDVLGFDGIKKSDVSDSVDAEKSTRADSTTYVWENSTVSFVRCEFVDGRLVTKEAKNLP